MATGCRHLQRPARLVLPHHVRQVGLVGGDRVSLRSLPFGLIQDRTTVQHLDQIGQAGNTPHGDAVHQRGFTHLTGWNDCALPTGLASRQQCGQHPVDATHATVKAQLAQQHAGRGELWRHHLGAGQHGSNDRQIVVTTRLGHAGRGQVDGQQLVGP